MSHHEKNTNTQLSKLESSCSEIESENFTNQPTRAAFTTLIKFKSQIPKVEIFYRNESESNYQVCKIKEKIEKFSVGRTKKIICKYYFLKIRKGKSKTHDDDAYHVKNQTKDRNVLSNLIHHLVKYLITDTETEKTFQKIIESKNFLISYPQFLKELEGISSNLRSYVTINHIKDLWFNENLEKQEFNQVMRIMSRSFYSRNGFLSVYYSNKFNASSKNIHIKGARSLIEILNKKDMDKLRFCIF